MPVEVGTPSLGIGGVVFVVLLTLKIAGNISLGWFWVITSIIWAPVIAIVGLTTSFMVIAVFTMLVSMILELLSR